jgi:hypothetical protein
MSSKHVHLYPGIGSHIKDQSRQKVETWNKSSEIYYVGNKANKKYLASNPDSFITFQKNL